MRGAWTAIGTLIAWFIHWSAHVLPMVHAGPVAMPGFTAAVLAVAFAVLGLVIRFMVIGPVLRAERDRAAQAAYA